MNYENQHSRSDGQRMKLMGLRATWMLLFIAAMATGCAFTDQNIHLTYNPALNASGGKGTLEIARPAAGQFTRGPSGKVVIGTVRNGFGMVTANTETNDSPDDWIVLALKTELAKAGYAVQLVESADPAASKAILPSLDRVWVDHDMGFFTVGANAEVFIRVQVIKSGVRIAEITSRGTAGPRSMFGGTATQKGEALQSAIRGCMQDAIPKIISALEQ